MRLLRTGYGIKIALATAFAVLVMGYGLFVAIYLIIRGHFDPFWSIETLGIAVSTLFLLLIMVGLCFGMRTLVMSKRQAQAVAARDPSAVSEASPQPDPGLALRSGEILTLRRRYSLSDRFHALASLLYLPAIIGLSEIVIFEALPAFGSSPLNPLYHPDLDGPPAPPPATLDWLAAAFPVLLAVCLLGYATWQNLRDGQSEIVADDAGISIRNGLKRRRVRWSEIDLFARTPDTSNIASPGSYIVWSRSQSLSFGVPGIQQEADYEPGSRSWSARYRFDGGYGVYARDARRVLATITARAHIPLLVVRSASERANQNRRDSAITSMTEERALALPLAEPRYSPSGDPASAELEEGETVSLQAHTWLQPVTGDWGVDFYMWIPTIWVFGWAIGQVTGTVTYLWPVAVVVIAAVALLVTLYVVLFIRQRPYSRMPDVSADESGLTTWGRYKDQPVTIAWERIAAWAVLRPPRGSIKPFRYVVVGDGLRLAWSEPTYGQYTWQSASSPQGTYRKQAERLHALIAARTGLPLRELHADAAQAIPAQVL
ncbi:MAG TPA: hypothetical protein VFS83_17675 [Ktedonobacterales bacterium]|nr:hypothetical protein [Ktedonobacterales bacterium]